MYISQIKDCNLGPISLVDISPSFRTNGNPKPLIVVGENGSGKSTFISNIVDAFYEIAGQGFQDVLHSSDGGNGYDYYKIISGLQIKIGKKYLFSRIAFDNGLEYFFKAGECSFDRFKEESGYNGNAPDWDIGGNQKQVKGLSNKEIERIFIDQVVCYFGPERYEKPSWMGQTYYDDLETHLYVEPRFNGKLQNPISPNSMGKENFRWLLDLIVDSRTDVENQDDGLKSVHVEIGNLVAMTRARANVEKLMSAILNEDVYFGLNLRRECGARFNIKKKSDDSIVAPTLDSLSTGQLALFNIFSTIIRYADNNDINKSIHLDQITGIVVIDEIEIHLHSIHQKEILPRLMKLFPCIQFIVTTHSPLFLLGMRDEYGEDGVDVYQMPEGLKINVEHFGEFNRAYDYYTSTELYHTRIKEAIDQVDSDKPLIITEGATDWKHLLAAYDSLLKQVEYKDIFDGLCFEVFKYEPASCTKDAKDKIHMGNTALVAMCESFSKMHQKRKMIFIADRDDKKTNIKMGEEGKNYKNWGNNVYSFLLPVPEMRRETPEICIEHLYSDNEIKTEHDDNGVLRRLYMGCEFNSKGISKELGKMCEKRNKCGPNKISIIEGSSGEKVTDIFGDEEINYALSKMKFAECILERKKGFENFDFSNFIDIFEIIKEIVSED